MKTKKERFTREFKIGTVQQLAKSEYSIKEMAGFVGIQPTTLINWINLYGIPEDFFTAKTNILKHWSSFGSKVKTNVCKKNKKF